MTILGIGSDIEKFAVGLEAIVFGLFLLLLDLLLGLFAVELGSLDILLLLLFVRNGLLELLRLLADGQRALDLQVLIHLGGP